MVFRFFGDVLVVVWWSDFILEGLGVGSDGMGEYWYDCVIVVDKL